MEIDWKSVRRVLVVRLRSIGDTVLATPSLIALKQFLPEAQVDILLEDWVAPILDGFPAVDNIVAVGKSGRSRFATSWSIRRAKYDVVFNLHGGTTGTFFTFASGAPHRVGYSHYQYKFLYNHVLTSSADFWGRDVTHSAEQQLAMLGYVGVPVDSEIKTRLTVNNKSLKSLEQKFPAKAHTPLSELDRFVLMHPAAAFGSKQWPVARFARTAEVLAGKNLKTVAVAAGNETGVLDQLRAESNAEIICFNDLNLPEITALASRASLFVGNDSGIAHIAAAVGTPSVVIFGSSNVDHWRPWTNSPNEVVTEKRASSDSLGEQTKTQSISAVTVEQVTSAIERVLTQ